MIDNIRKLVRPFIAFCFVGTISYLAITGKIDPREVLTIVSLIIGFYFGERAVLKGSNDDRP